MRKGSNPAKSAAALPGYAPHRIIIPIYIPALSGFFESMLEVLKICLNSLRETMPAHCEVTLISNDSAPEVETFLRNEYELGWIDQLVLNQKNRGKVDAIISAARASYCEVVTFADCDTLFMAGWAEAIEQIFRAFPECGSVSPFPSSNLYAYNTASTISGALEARVLRYGSYVRSEAFDLIGEGLGNDPNVNFRNSQWVVQRNGTTACVGGGHFVISFHRSVVEKMDRRPSLSAISQGSEKRWLDEYPDRVGLWRLSTTSTLVYHLGNTPIFPSQIQQSVPFYRQTDYEPLVARRRRFVTYTPGRSMIVRLLKKIP